AVDNPVSPPPSVESRSGCGGAAQEDDMSKLLLAVVLAATMAGGVAAQIYPSRPITMVVPFAAGGGTDVVGRILGERMRASLGQPIIVENVGGANGSIGVGRVARAAPDGHTLILGA